MKEIFGTNQEYPFSPISSEGRIATIKSKDKEEKEIRATFFNESGYERITVKRKDGKLRNRWVSYLVFTTFFQIPKDGKKYQIHHRNWVRSDNRLTNLALIETHLHKKLNSPQEFSLNEIYIDFDKIGKEELSGWISLDEFLGAIHFVCEKRKATQKSAKAGQIIPLEELFLDFNECDVSNLSGLVPITSLMDNLYYKDKLLDEIQRDSIITIDQIEKKNYLVDIA